MAACYFLHSFSGGAKSAEGPCEFDPPRQECTGKNSTGNTFACAAQRLGGGLNCIFGVAHQGLRCKRSIVRFAFMGPGLGDNTFTSESGHNFGFRYWVG